MRIPRTLKIGGRNIKVRTKVMEDLGLADFEKGVIYLKRGLNREAKEATFLHEWLHHANSTLPHTTIDSLAEQLHQLMKQID